jgi:hypothetical protein
MGKVFEAGEEARRQTASLNFKKKLLWTHSTQKLNIFPTKKS